jgi:hypothetical protein
MRTIWNMLARYLRRSNDVLQAPDRHTRRDSYREYVRG